jgi:hypothetical protein
MNRTHLKILTPFILLGVLASCGKDKSSSPNNTATNTTPSTNTVTPDDSAKCNFGTGDEDGVSTNGQTTDYYTLPSHDVIMHGAAPGVVVFNSQLDLSGYNENIFKTDGRMNIRVIPRMIGKGTDSRGNTCTKQMAAQEFTKMNIGIVVRAASGTSGVGDYHFFEDVPVGCASEVHEFDVPATSDPLVIEVLNVTNDQDCLEDQSRSITSGRNCPYTDVGSMECYALDIQFSTDTTKDIPH